MGVQYLGYQDALSSLSSGGSLSMIHIGQPQKLLVVAFNMQPAIATISSLIWNTNVGAAGPNFGSRREARIVGTSSALELWLCWGIPTYGSIGLSYTATGFTSGQSTQLAMDCDGVQTSSASLLVVSAFGNGLSVDPGLVTPDIDDGLLAYGTWTQAVTTASTARTDTPGGIQGMGDLTTVSLTSTGRIESAFRRATTVTPAKRVWTIGTARDWVAAAVAVKPTPGTVLSTTGLYKGRGTKILDAVGGA